MSIIKIGLIGAGSIGVRHIMAIDALSDVALVAMLIESLGGNSRWMVKFTS